MRRSLEWLGGSVLVYALIAACSGGARTATTSPPDGAAGERGAGVGGAPGNAGGAPAAEAGQKGGILDPVPNAGAQEAGSGPGTGGPALTFTETEVACDGEITINGTNYPAAILDIDPPSPVVAAMTVHVMAQTNAYEAGWVQAATGGVIRQNGSQLAIQCAKAADSVTFHVPSF